MGTLLHLFYLLNCKTDVQEKGFYQNINVLYLMAMKEKLKSAVGSSKLLL